MAGITGGRRKKIEGRGKEGGDGRKEGRKEQRAKVGESTEPTTRCGEGKERQRRSERRTMDEEKRGGMKVCGIVHIASRGSICPAGFPG